MAIYEYLHNGKTVDVRIDGKNGKYRVTMGDGEYELEACQLSQHLLSVLGSGGLTRAFVAEKNGTTYVHMGGRIFTFDDAAAVSDSRAGGKAGAGVAPGAITSQMPGNLIKVIVKEGETVKEGQPLVIVEAMKMENEIRSPSDGVVKAINFAVGDLVEAGVPIVELETEGEEE